jgi:hypothetical protein
MGVRLLTKANLSRDRKFRTNLAETDMRGVKVRQADFGKPL